MYFIVNKHAGGGQGYRIFIKKILPRIKKETPNFGFQATSSKKEAITLAKSLVKQNEKSIIVCGGDGGANALIKPLLNSKTALGILPLGSANDFALASLGIPPNPIRALHTLLDGKTMVTDVGMVNSFYFLNVFGIGIDADITHLAHKHPVFRRMPLKELRYGFPLMRELRNPSFSKVKISVDNKSMFSGNAFFLGVYNGKREGAYFYLNNKGSISDGLLNGMVIENVSFQQRLSCLIKIAQEDFQDLPMMHPFEGKEIKISVFNNQIITAQVDGEPIIFESKKDNTTLIVKNIPKALRVIVPKM